MLQLKLLPANTLYRSSICLIAQQERRQVSQVFSIHELRMLPLRTSEMIHATTTQVFMGWIWFIPTFHMTHPRAVGQQPTIFRLTRKEIDFPLGIGSHIIDVEVTMEWCAADADIISPPARQDSQDSAEGRGDPSGIGAAIHAAAIGEAQHAADASRVGDE